MIQMVVDKNAQLFHGTINAGQTIFQPRKNGFESVDLNQVQKFLLALDVVIQPRQRNAARFADVAYRSAFVTLLAENLRVVAQYYLKFFLALRLWHRRSWHKGDAPFRSNVRSVSRILPVAQPVNSGRPARFA